MVMQLCQWGTIHFTQNCFKYGSLQVVVGPAPTLTPGQFSDSFNDFTSICLNKKAEDRASFSQLLEHAFLDSNKEVEVGAFFKEILHLET